MSVAPETLNQYNEGRVYDGNPREITERLPKPRGSETLAKASIREEAHQAAAEADILKRIRAGAEADRELITDLCRRHDVDPPKSRYGIGPEIFRVCDPEWWLKKLETRSRRNREHIAMDVGEIGRGEGRKLYCTDQAVFDWRAMRARNREFLQQTFVFNDDLYLASLAEVAERSLANPEVRRAEMFARLRGLEQYAQWRRHDGLFVTITCPSKFHPNSSKYAGYTPKGGQDHLCKTWAKIRAKLARQGIEYYGMRIAEPHNDGCPHWHMLLWCAPRYTWAVKQIIRSYGLEVDGGEPGARERRVVFEDIDPGKGGAVSYIAKYISKNIDGRKANGESVGAVTDRDGDTQGDAIIVAERILAWSSLWGIRQFQQIGGERVGPYRELRRIHSEITASKALEGARIAADAGDFAFYQAMQEHHRATEGTAALIQKRNQAQEAIRRGDSDAVIRSFLNHYYEPTIEVIGVTDGNETVVTRRDDWRVMTVETIHAMYEASDEADQLEYWGEICELLNLWFMDRERPPGRE